MNSAFIVDPDEIGDVAQLDYQTLCYRFIGRQIRLSKLQQCNAPEVIINAEKALVQKAYNQMREKCLKDEYFVNSWGVFAEENP